MNIKQLVFQRVVLSIRVHASGHRQDTSHFGNQVGASQSPDTPGARWDLLDRHLDRDENAERNEISDHMHEAFIDGDQRRWNVLADHYLDRCSTAEIDLYGDMLTFLTQAFKDSPHLFTRENAMAVVSEAYDRAKAKSTSCHVDCHR